MSTWCGIVSTGGAAAQERRIHTRRTSPSNTKISKATGTNTHGGRYEKYPVRAPTPIDIAKAARIMGPFALLPGIRISTRLSNIRNTQRAAVQYRKIDVSWMTGIFICSVAGY